jgi:ABC-type sugar transport system ATPase subunit
VTSANPLLQMTQIVKTYEGIIALDHVDFRVGHGEIVALIGDNGAGKSTLTKVLAGALRPDSGEITLPGGRQSPEVVTLDWGDTAVVSR